MVVVLLGPPGVGKGTQAVRLADEIGAEHVSTGDLLRGARRAGTDLGKRAQRYMDGGELVPDELILDIMRDHLTDVEVGTGVLFDGFPRTKDQATRLDVVLKDIGFRIDTVVLFEAPEEILVQRLSGRRICPDCGAVFNTYFNPPATEGNCDRCGGILVHRLDDAAGTVRRRLQVYIEHTEPLVALYEERGVSMSRVAADRDVEDVFADFRRAIGVAA